MAPPSLALPPLYLREAVPLAPRPPESRAPSLASRPETGKRRRGRPPIHEPLGEPAKPTYLARKEELEELRVYVEALETQLELLRGRAGLPTKEDHDEIREARRRNAGVLERLHTNDLFLARLHSMVTRELLEPPLRPLSTFIHLPHEMAARKAVLRAMQETKLRRAQQVAHEQLHHLDHSQAYLSEQKFTAANGDFHVERMVIVPLPNFRSARQLFDCLLNHMYNTEFTVTEILGQLVVREDQDDNDPTIWNQRIITVADDVGCTEELNMVIFCRFYEGASPFGIVTFDTVDVDDLYPYVPHERVRKDLQSVNLVCEVPLPGSSAPLVVFKQCLFMTQPVPQFPLEPDKLRQLQDNCAKWPAAMTKWLREQTPNA